MQGYYDIEKYKAEFVDGEWIPKELIETRTEKNFIHFGVRSQFYSGGVGICSQITVDDARVFATDQRLFIMGTRVYTKSWRLSLMDNNSGSNFIDRPIRGDQSTGKEQPVRVNGTPNTVTTEARWNPSSSLRTIYTIGCHQDSTRNNPISSVTLSTPCTQDIDELLIIKYRYSWYDDIQDEYMEGVHPDDKFYIADLVAFAYPTPNPYGKPTAISYSSFDIPTEGALDNTVFQTSNLTSNKINFIDGWEITSVSTDNSSGVGRLLNTCSIFPTTSGLHTGYSAASRPTEYYNGYAHNSRNVKFRRPQDTVINSTFHKSKAVDAISKVPKPFLDTDYIGNGIGRAIISDTIINGDTSYDTINGIAELFRVEMVTSGAVNTATYKIAKRIFIGVENQNNWIPRVSAKLNIPISRDYNQLVTTPVTQRINNGDQFIDTGLLANASNREATANSIGYHVETYNFPEYISVNTKPSGRNAVFIRSIYASDQKDYIEYSSSSSPALPVTNISQIEGFDDGTIMVACKNTGLWKIERNIGDAVGLATITQMSPSVVDASSCQAFSSNAPKHTSKMGTRWYALFTDELAYTDNQGTSWTVLNASTSPQFTISSITPANMLGLSIDTEHVDERMCFFGTSATFNDDGSYDQASAAAKSIVIAWYSIGQSTTTSDEFFVNTSTNMSADLYPISAENMIHNIIGTDQWLIGIRKQEFGTTNATIAYLYGTANLTTFIYSEELNQYGFFKSEQYYGQLSPTTNGYAFVNIDQHITGVVDIITKPSLTLNSGNTSHGVFMGGAYIGRGVFLCRSDEALINTSNFYGERDVSQLTLMDISLSETNPTNDGYVDNTYGSWEYYGWNGSSWVKDHAGAKATHLSTDPIINGLSITFEESVGNEGDVGTFDDNDIYDTYVFDGLVKDDTTNYEQTFFSFFGAGRRGTTLSSYTIPSPVGVTTIPFAVESQIDNANSYHSRIVSETDYIGSYGHALTTVAGGSFPDSVTVGPDLDGDFDIAFGMSSNYYSIYSTSPYSIDNASFGVSAKSSISTSSANSPEFGIFIIPDNEDPDAADIVFRNNGADTTLAISDFDPINDEYRLRRISGTLELVRNASTIHTYGTTINGVMKGVYFSFTERYSLNIWNATVTFDDLRHVVRVGDNVSENGVFGTNFARMSYEYFLYEGNIIIDGVPAIILPRNGVGVPGTGQVYVCSGSGELVFGASDIGKTISASWMEIPKINDTRG